MPLTPLLVSAGLAIPNGCLFVDKVASGGQTLYFPETGKLTVTSGPLPSLFANLIVPPWERIIS